MRSARSMILLSVLLLVGALVGAPSRFAYADDMIVPDVSPEDGSESEAQTETETETEAGPLMETEMVYEIPAGITDGLKANAPTGEAAAMTVAECEALVGKMCDANAAGRIWARHENVSATFRRFDEETQAWKEYSTFYADPLVYYSDDWTPGLEELRLLIYGENGCVEDYTSSMRFVCFLNASGTPYRSPKTDPVTLDEETRQEALLAVHRMPDALYLITRLTEPSILRLGLEEPQEGEFYSSLYLLDPGSMEVQAIRISLHEADGNAKDRLDLSFSYDHGMTPFVETGYTGLLRHLTPDVVWEPEDLREVRVTLDPGTDAQRVSLLTTLKGDPVSITLPEGYTLYADEALTTPWTDNGDYTSDLSLWAAAE